MPIKSIKIQYYKSFKDCKALLKDVNIIIGENGSGKSNFIEAIDYFYQNLTETHLSDTVFDATTLIISKKPGNTGISRDIRTEFTTDLLLSD